MPEDLTAGNGTAGAGEAAEDNTGNRNTGSKEGASGGRYTGGGTGKEGGNELPGTRETAVLPESGASKDKEDENGEDSGGEKETASGAGTKGTEAGKTASGWKSFWYGVLCQAADIFLSAPTPFKAWLHDKMGFRDSVSVLFEKEVYEADLSGGNYTIQEEGSPFALINNAVKASTGKELSSEAYRQVSYVNDISFSNEQVLMERAVNGSLGESVTGYSYGLWRESYSVEADAGTGISIGMGTGSGTYYYTGTGNVANLVTGSGTKGYSYGPGGAATVYGQGSLESRTNTQAGSYGYNGEYTHGSLGLQYLRARYLKMETGTFTSRDTYAGRVRDIISQNRYTYAENNPVTFADPSGHKITIGTTIGNMFGGGRNTGRNSGIGGIIGNAAQTVVDKVTSTINTVQNTTRNTINRTTGNHTAVITNTTENIVAQATGGITSTFSGGSQSVNGPGGVTDFVESDAAQVEVVRCGAYARCSNEEQDRIRDVSLAAGAAYFDDMIGRTRIGKVENELVNDIGYNFKYDWMREGLPSTPFVTLDFMREVVNIAGRLGIDPDDLMAVMAFESWFNPREKNTVGGTATGLIQINELSAGEIGITTSELAEMNAIEQLEYVYRYYEPYDEKINNLGDLYMATFCKRGIGEDDNYPLYETGSRGYDWNSGLDGNKDGVITRGEALQAVLDRRKEYE